MSFVWENKMNIENLHIGEYIVITNPNFQMAGFPAKILAIQQPNLIAVDFNGRRIPLIPDASMNIMKCNPSYIEAMKPIPQNNQLTAWPINVF